MKIHTIFFVFFLFFFFFLNLGPPVSSCLWPNTWKNKPSSVLINKCLTLYLKNICISIGYWLKVSFCSAVLQPQRTASIPVVNLKSHIWKSLVWHLNTFWSSVPASSKVLISALSSEEPWTWTHKSAAFPEDFQLNAMTYKSFLNRFWTWLHDALEEKKTHYSWNSFLTFLFPWLPCICPYILGGMD